MLMSNRQLEMTSVPDHMCKLSVPERTHVTVKLLQRFTTINCVMHLEIIRVQMPQRNETFCSRPEPKYRQKDWRTTNMENVYIRAVHANNQQFETRIWMLIQGNIIFDSLSLLYIQ